MKNDPVEKALAALDDALDSGDGAKLAAAIRSKYNFVAEKAARMIANRAAIDLAPELEKALAARLDQPAAADKGCLAKLAIVRALVQLEYDAPEVCERGIRHIQMEASFGPPIDTAAEFRAACAMALVNGSHRDKLRVLLPLLIDKEWQARAGAIRAIGVEGSEAAMLLLRFKAMTGDENPDVIYECFSSLIAAERAMAVEFIDGYCDSPRDEIAESAMLALGASRRNDAIETLKRRFEGRRNPRLTKALLLAIATSRSDEARAWLQTIAERDGADGEAARSAIESCWPERRGI